ncbi:MAG: universal stress protein, partial [Bacteroidetes bacterium]|nr:universal stress protein [Bacteroidota bacterium]
MQTILVPIDFSEDSLNALHMAINVAKASQAEVKMIHVNKTRMFLSFVRAKPTENPEDIKRDFTDLISHTAHEGVNLDYV